MLYSILNILFSQINRCDLRYFIGSDTTYPIWIHLNTTQKESFYVVIMHDVGYIFIYEVVPSHLMAHDFQNRLFF
jgi:hypothetical protein